MQVINTNAMSLNAQRNLAGTNGALAQSIQRLSSGLRINSAKDDAAGLAISERFTTQIRGLNQAVRNANDGISLAQTAEGALGEIGNNLQRIRELAVQAVNATNSASDRAALDAEAQALKAEIDRVALQTEFNGARLLDGSFAGQAFQVGSNAGQLITLDAITSARVAELGLRTVGQPGEASTMSLGALSQGNYGNIAQDQFLVAFDTGSEQLQLDVTAAINDGLIIAEDLALAFVNAGFAANGDNEVSGFSLDLAGRASIEQAIDEGVLVVRRADGQSFTRTDTIIESAPGSWTQVPTLSGGTTSTGGSGQEVQGFADLNLLDASAATDAILAMDAALQSVNSQRADLGATQNRFGSVIANLQTSAENLSASRSRIRDTDFAAETAELTRTQILQQAGTAMLAQANQVPQSVLSLI